MLLFLQPPETPISLTAKGFPSRARAQSASEKQKNTKYLAFLFHFLYSFVRARLRPEIPKMIAFFCFFTRRKILFLGLHQGDIKGTYVARELQKFHILANERGRKPVSRGRAGKNLVPTLKPGSAWDSTLCDIKNPLCSYRFFW